MDRFTDISIPADYRDKQLPEFAGNPLAEALPDLLTDEELAVMLAREPYYQNSDRFLSAEMRVDMTQRLYDFHQPMPQDIDIARRIFRCIRWGYVNRNPLAAAQVSDLNARYAALRDGAKTLPVIHRPNVSGFTIIGISGIGKTCTLEGILSLYPQVISHTCYKDSPFVMKQIVWLKLDCTFDGSIKGLCAGFFSSLDRLLGTEYYRMYTSRHNTVDTMMNMMTQLASIYGIGLLVIDEIQHLSTAKSGGQEKMLNFFVTLVNTIGLPVVLVGTPKALPILQSEFRQARRGSGQGDLLWDSMQNGIMWKMFVRSMWKYQYTRETVPFSDEMADALYNESGGIPFLAVTIYKLVQEDAILMKKETFTPKDIRRVTSEKMRLTEPMRKALLSGKDVDIYRYADIRPFTGRDHLEAAAVTGDTVSQDPVQNTVKEDPVGRAVKTLLGMDVSYQDAFRCVMAASSCLGQTADAKKLAKEAYRIYLEPEKQDKEADAGDLRNMQDYESLKKGGVVGGEL